MPIGNKADFALNQEPRCPVVLLLDNSDSMSGEPIKQLNEGIAVFKQSLEQDTLAKLRIEVAIVSFGPVVMRQDFFTIDQFVPPQLDAQELTPTGEAIEYALNLLEERKVDYQNNGIQSYRPWVFLITNGEPNDDWQKAAQRVRQGEKDNKFSFFAVGVQDADMGILSQIAPPNREALLLNGLDFKSMFLWLSQSMKQVSRSQPGERTEVDIPPVKWNKVELEIQEIIQRYPKQWVTVGITKRDDYGFPAIGQVLLQANDVDSMLDKTQDIKGELYIFYTGSIDDEA